MEVASAAHSWIVAVGDKGENPVVKRGEMTKKKIHTNAMSNTLPGR